MINLLMYRHILSWLVGSVMMYRIPLCRSEDRSMPSISVVIPARNEAERLPELLSSLRDQEVPHEVIVVDDASDDDTASVAGRFGARVISAGNLPAQWSGKAWACWRGAGAARGEILVFLDADTFLEPGGLHRLVSTHDRLGGLVTVQPFHIMARAYEQMSVLFYIVMVASMAAFTPLQARLRPSGAFSACVVCSRDEYFQMGGHGVSRGSVVEGLVMAQAFRRAGMLVSCLGGRGTISVRMYSRGTSELIRGFGKSFASGAQQVGILPVLLVVLWVSGMSASAVDLLTGVFALDVTRSSVVLYGMFAAQVHWMASRLGNYRWYVALFYPIPLLFFVLSMLRSLVLTFVMGRVDWKGRNIRTR